jgi:hypothetical protein
MAFDWCPAPHGRPAMAKVFRSADALEIRGTGIVVLSVEHAVKPPKPASPGRTPDLSIRLLYVFSECKCFVLFAAKFVCDISVGRLNAEGVINVTHADAGGSVSLCLINCKR